MILNKKLFTYFALFGAFLFLSSNVFAAKQHKHKVHSQGTAQQYHKQTDLPRSTSSAINLNAAIAKTVAKYDPNIDIGIQVQSLSDGKILYQQNAYRLFKPASSLKVFTAAAALKYLGPSYQFKTQILAKAPIPQNGVLNSDLYFYFDGDPSLQRQYLVELINDLQQKGITKIQGNIYIDDSVFDQNSYGPGWMWDEKNLCYAAPTHAVMLDKNCFPFTIHAKQENHPAQISSTHELESMIVTSSVIAKRIGANSCPFDLRVNDDNHYYLSGCVWPNSEPFTLVVAVKNIRLYTSQVLEDILLAHNITWTGKVKFARSPLTDGSALTQGKDYFVLASHESAPLSQLVKIMLKKSDNLIADALFKKLGNAYFHKTATWYDGSQAVARILQQNGRINFSDVRLVDGSGLSHYNLVSPSKMSELLNYVYSDADIRAPFWTALPNGGVDGSLAYRMSAADLRGKVHAKTGTMSGISSLAGYVQASNGKVFSFAIIINDFIGKAYKYRMMEDDICALLVRGNL